MARKSVTIRSYIDRLEQAIGLGATYQLAARYAGVSSRTLSRWRSQAEDAKPGTPLAELRDRLRQAEGRAAVRWLTQIERAASNGDWRSAAYMLEHRYPETYGRRVKADLTLQIHQMVQEVAADIGVDPGLLLAEATTFLREYDQRHGR